MTGSLALFEHPVRLRRVLTSTEELYERFLLRRSARTRQGYEESLRDFARFLGPHLVLLDALSARKLPADGLSSLQAADILLSQDQQTANTLALDYVLNMQTRPVRGRERPGLSPNTVNTRLYMLRSLAKMARLAGRIDWAIEIDPDKRRRSYRDTSGPGRAGVAGIMEVAQRHRDPSVRARDAALIALGYDLALRRGEVVSLNVEDLDLQAGAIHVLGKGRSEPDRLTVPTPTRETLARWLEQRGGENGPFMYSFDRSQKGERGRRLTGRGIAYIIRRLGRVLGIRANYHGLRHAAITDALDATGGDIRAVMRFSRHRDPRTLEIYDDARHDHGGQIAQLVAERARNGADDDLPA